VDDMTVIGYGSRQVLWFGC